MYNDTMPVSKLTSNTWCIEKHTAQHACTSRYGLTKRCERAKKNFCLNVNQKKKTIDKIFAQFIMRLKF